MLRLVLPLATVAMALAAAEWWCRVSFRRNVSALRFSESDLYYYYDPAGLRRHIPNKVGYERMWNDVGKAEFRINSLGFRGEEIGLQKPKGGFRIMFLGDSITLGGRLPEDATFVSRIGRALRVGGSGTAAHYQVVNAGVGDVGLIEEGETLKTALDVVQPDLVVLGWYLNDGRPPIGFPEEVVYQDPLIRWFNQNSWLMRSYLLGFVYDRRRKSLVQRHLEISRSHRFDWTLPYMAGRWVGDPRAFARLVESARFDWGDAWNSQSLKRMGREIIRLRDLAQKRGARFVVVMLPEQAQAVGQFAAPILDQPQRELGGILKEAGIPTLDLLPILRGRNREPLFYDNCHYTPHGNEVVAEAILRFLRTLRVLDVP